MNSNTDNTSQCPYCGQWYPIGYYHSCPHQFYYPSIIYQESLIPVLTRIAEALERLSPPLKKEPTNEKDPAVL